MIVLGESPVGGILDLAEREVPETIPAHWQVYFAVEDTDATIEAAKAGGRRRHGRADRHPRSAASRSSPTRTGRASR